MTIEGRVHSVSLGTAAGRALEVQLFDGTGGLRLLFMGRTHIPGIAPGVLVRATGRVGEYRQHLAIANPRYELVVAAPAEGPRAAPSAGAGGRRRSAQDAGVPERVPAG